VLVSASLPPLPEKIQKEIQNGLPKEIEYQVDVMRSWDRWLDEYMAGLTLVRTIKYDVLKKEYRLSSLEGRYLYEKTVTDLNEAVRWLTVLSEVPVAEAASLPPGRYYVRVDMASRRMQVTGLFSVLMFFMSETDFSMTAVSESFMVLP